MPRIVQLAEGDNYELPDGAMSFNANGWSYGDLYSVGIALDPGFALRDALETLSTHHGSLLGPGELLFVTRNETGRRQPDGKVIVDGALVFVPAT